MVTPAMPTRRELSRVIDHAGLVIPSRLAEEIDRAMADHDADSGMPLAWVPGRVYESRLAQAQSSRKAAGQFYTPQPLVDFVLTRALSGRAQARVADLACGGAAFLLGAYQAGVSPEALFGFDIDPVAVDISKLALLYAGVRSPQVYLRDSLTEDFAQDFDAIIGNPPWGQKAFRFPPDIAATLRKRYRTATGVLDPFKLFIEKSVELLRDGGRFGLILPDIILLKNHQAVRDLLLETTTIEWIAHLGRAFRGVNIDAVAMIARKGPCGREHEVQVVVDTPPSLSRMATQPIRRVAQAWFWEQPEHRFNIFLTAKTRALLLRLGRLTNFGDVFEIHEGIHSGNCRDKLFVDHQINSSCRKLIFGRDEISPGRLVWQGRWIDLEPGAIDRAAGDYANLGRQQWHEAKKLVVRRTGDRVIAAYDDVGYYCSNNLFVVLPKSPMSDAQLRGYERVLNSVFMTFYFRCIQPRTGRLFAELKINHLCGFPVPPGDIVELVGLEDGAFEAELASRYSLSPEEQALIS